MIKVLAVEDDPASRYLYESIGARSGWDVTSVHTCHDALALLESDNFDVVLMDWQLVRSSGLECTREIRLREQGTGKHIPVIAITANAMNGHREACLEAGLDDYLSKPFRVNQLIDIVSRWSKTRAQD